MRSSILLVAAHLAFTACGASTSDTDSGVTDAHVATDAPSIDAPGSDGGSGHADLGGCTDSDSDGDGHAAISCGGDDCDDHDGSRYPGNPEVCDTAGHDDDCNPATLGPDHDGDGFPALTCCDTQASGTLLCGWDCNDTSMDISPSAPESCNGIDDNCNGMIDEALSTSPYRPDCDGDGFGDAMTAPMMLCAPPASAPGCLGGGWVTLGGDCDDHDPNLHPGATETCNHVDDNCDGSVDEGLATQNYYEDCDGDGHGSSTAPALTDCVPPPAPPVSCPTRAWTVVDATDCCDSDGRAYLHAASFSRTATACGGFDFDCDGSELELDPYFIATSVCPTSACPLPVGGPYGAFLGSAAAACGVAALWASCSDSLPGGPPMCTSTHVQQCR